MRARRTKTMECWEKSPSPSRTLQALLRAEFEDSAFARAVQNSEANLRAVS